jgi:Ca2+/Na+ antiporter
VLAVATSLPNTVVAYQLARSARAEACVEEILSSNGVNLALGAALPALVWGIRAVDPAFLSIDLPLLFGLGLVAVTLLYVRRIPRLVGVGLIGLYVLWIMTYRLQYRAWSARQVIPTAVRISKQGKRSWDGELKRRRHGWLKGATCDLGEDPLHQRKRNDAHDLERPSDPEPMGASHLA